LLESFLQKRTAVRNNWKSHNFWIMKEQLHFLRHSGVPDHREGALLSGINLKANIPGL